MSIEFLIPTLFALKATAILGFAAYQIMTVRAVRQTSRVAAEVSSLPQREKASFERGNENRLAA